MIEDEPLNKVSKKDVPERMDIEEDIFIDPARPITRSISNMRQLDVNDSSEEEAKADTKTYG